MKSTLKTEYNAALYCRLSRDDNNGSSESMSIQSQRDMLTEYAEEYGYSVYDTYIDDGYTGTNFDRPNFKRMIEDMENGKINMVITKDNSRLGRNYVSLGLFRERFSEYGVRYISVNDCEDSLLDNNNMVVTAVKDVMNEMYAMDISRKIRSSRKVAAKQGKFMGSKPPYGYIRHPNDKHMLVIDDNVAGIAKRIFTMFANGDSARNIGSILNRENVETPNEYYYKSIGQSNPYTAKTQAWGSATIMTILRSQVYIGNIVQGKQHVASHKTKKRVKVDPKDWVIVEGMHEPLIDMETWTAVQNRLENEKPVRVSSQSEVSLFSGLVRCADCGGLMAYNVKSSSGKKYYVYRCGTYANNGTGTCTTHNIHQSTLETAVLNDIRHYSRLALKDETALIDRLMRANVSNQQKSADVYRKQITAAKKRTNEINNLAKSLFEEKTAGNMPDTFFKKMLFDYDNEQKELTEKIEKLQKNLAECEANANDVTAWISRIKKCINIDTLDRGILVELIDNITVSEMYRVDGEKRQDITITYKFVGCLDDKNKLFVA